MMIIINSCTFSDPPHALNAQCPLQPSIPETLGPVVWTGPLLPPFWSSPSPRAHRWTGGHSRPYMHWSLSKWGYFVPRIDAPWTRSRLACAPNRTCCRTEQCPDCHSRRDTWAARSSFARRGRSARWWGRRSAGSPWRPGRRPWSSCESAPDPPYPIVGGAGDCCDRETCRSRAGERVIE